MDFSKEKNESLKDLLSKKRNECKSELLSIRNHLIQTEEIQKKLSDQVFSHYPIKGNHINSSFVFTLQGLENDGLKIVAELKVLSFIFNNLFVCYYYFFALEIRKSPCHYFRLKRKTVYERYGEIKFSKECCR